MWILLGSLADKVGLERAKAMPSLCQDVDDVGGHASGQREDERLDGRGYPRGLHADDPDILFGLARAQFGLQEYANVIQTLDRLAAANPKSRTGDMHLLYARAQEESGAIDAAKAEYEALARYYPGPEPRCRLGLILKARGDAEGARKLFQSVLGESDVAGRHYNVIHKEWIALARREA